MNRRVERSFIDKWIENHSPDGVQRLARTSGVSVTTINRTRCGDVPKRQCTRDELCKALKVREDDLFPPVELDKGMVC